MKKRNEYCGLTLCMEKQGILISGGLTAAAIGKGLMGAWAAYSAANALKHGGKAVGSAFRGDRRQALKHLGTAGMEAVFALPGLGQIGGAAKATAVAGRLARGGKTIGRLRKSVPLLRRIGGKIPFLGRHVAQTATKIPAGRRLAQTGINRMAKGRIGAYVAKNPRLQQGLWRAGTRLQGIDRRLGLLTIPVVGYSMIRGGAQAGRPQPAAPARTPYSGLRIPQSSRPQIRVPVMK